MNRALPWLLLLSLAACPKTQSKTCTVSSCAGCCSADDRCELGTSAAACGEGGNQCVACESGKSCSLGACTLTGSGGGSGTGGGSISAGGGAAAGGGTGGGGSATGGGAATGGGSGAGGGSAAGGGSSAGGGSGTGGGDGGSAADAGATLVGITWAMLPNDGGEEQIRTIDLSTGESTRIGSVTGLYWVILGGATDDPLSRVDYLIGSGYSGPPTLYLVDEAAGTTLNAVVLDEDGGLNWSGGLHLRADKSLVGVTWHQFGDGGIEELRSIDTTTGGSALIAQVPKLDWLNSAANAIDPVSGTIYVVGYSNADSTYYIHQIDSVSGADTLSVPLGSAFSGWDELHVRSDGRLLALQSQLDGGFGLVTVDPSYGTTNAVGGRLPIDWITFGSTYDRVDDRLYVLGGNGHGGGAEVVVVDGFSGAVLNQLTLADDAGYQFNWSGGLHVYH